MCISMVLLNKGCMITCWTIICCKLQQLYINQPIATCLEAVVTISIVSKRPAWKWGESVKVAQKWSAEGEGESEKFHLCILLFFLFCCKTLESGIFICKTFVGFFCNVLKCSVFVVKDSKILAFVADRIILHQIRCKIWCKVGGWW